MHCWECRYRYAKYIYLEVSSNLWQNLKDPTPGFLMRQNILYKSDCEMHRGLSYYTTQYRGKHRKLTVAALVNNNVDCYEEVFCIYSWWRGTYRCMSRDTSGWRGSACEWWDGTWSWWSCCRGSRWSAPPRAAAGGSPGTPPWRNAGRTSRTWCSPAGSCLAQEENIFTNSSYSEQEMFLLPVYICGQQ